MKSRIEKKRDCLETFVIDNEPFNISREENQEGEKKKRSSRKRKTRNEKEKPKKSLGNMVFIVMFVWLVFPLSDLFPKILPQNPGKQGLSSRIKRHLVTASRGSSQKDQWQWSRALSESDHYLIDIASSLRIGFQASFDSAFPLFTPLWVFGFPSPVIVIVEIHFGI